MKIHFSGCGLSDEIRMAAEVAVLAGLGIKSGRWSSEAITKAHSDFGTATYSESDTGAEDLILRELSKNFPSAAFLTEEGGGDKLTPEELLTKDLVFGVDPLDGSTDERHKHGFYSVSIGVMRNGEHTGGAVFNPELSDGRLMVSERGRGVFLWEHEEAAPQKIQVPISRPKKPIIWLGLDVQRSDAYQAFLIQLPKELRPRGIAASCATGLALMAAGRLDALLQSPQMPHDFFGGYPSVLESGLAFLCYHIVDGKVCFLEKPTTDSYRTDKQMLGFFAGQPSLVEELAPMLSKFFGRQVEIR